VGGRIGQGHCGGFDHDIGKFDHDIGKVDVICTGVIIQYIGHTDNK
jgi:hypothetical protein